MQFKKILKESFKNASIVADNFHCCKLSATAVDKIRMELWRKHKEDSSAQGREIRKYLKSLKTYLLTDIKACENEKYIDKVSKKLEAIFKYLHKLKIAYEKLQSFYNIKRITDINSKVNTFKEWVNTIDIKVLSTFKSVKKTMYMWFTYIKNPLIAGYSNGKTEGNSNSIKVLKRNSYGFVNFETAKNRILVCC